jgi:hypothetical protein
LALLGRRIYIKTTLLAATTLESVITAGNYSLVADSIFFEAEGENGAESVFEVLL